MHEHPLKEGIRARSNHYVTGARRRARHRFAQVGARRNAALRAGSSISTAPGLAFARDLKANLDSADTVSESIKDTIDRHIERNAISAPLEARYVPVWEPGSARSPRTRLRRRKHFGDRLVHRLRFELSAGSSFPQFDGKGYPTHERGITSVEGLYFLGLPWLYTWGSGRFSGIARDAEYLGENIARAN